MASSTLDHSKYPPADDRSRPKLLVITQDDCFKHIYRRSKLASATFERPERLRFVNLGLAAALAWNSIHTQNGATKTPLPIELLPPSQPQQHPSSSYQLIRTRQVSFAKSIRKLSSNDSAFDRIHDQPNQVHHPPTEPLTQNSSDPTHSKFSNFRTCTNYLDQLIGLCRLSSELHHLGLSELPEHLPQGDLYLSTGSETAILGAIGTCYSAVDSILKPRSITEDEPDRCLEYQKAFVNVRPPGHHCTNSEPMGFCWVNNVLISCMYSHLTYGINRICIVDIDLHHGNGSQEIVWKLNQRSQSILSSRSTHSNDSSNGRALSNDDDRQLQLSYSSLHDINSYPCEDGDPEKIKEASLNISVGNSINQFIQNLHIQDWSDESDFYQRLYPKIWSSFQDHMINFFQITHASPDHSLIFVSAGFDACEYETDEMSRFGKKLPVSFYHRFAKDLNEFSEKYCRGRIISILEGGYSEQTLTGSSLSYILGLMNHSFIDHNNKSKEVPWSLDRINQLLKLCNKKIDRNRNDNTTTTIQHLTRLSLNDKPDRQEEVEEESIDSLETNWILETKRLFDHIDSYVQIKNELNKLNRLEEKQIKSFYHSLSQSSLLSHTEPLESKDGLRRSQRRVISNSKKIGISTSFNDKSTQQRQSLKSPQLPISIELSNKPKDELHNQENTTIENDLNLSENDHPSPSKLSIKSDLKLKLEQEPEDLPSLKARSEDVQKSDEDSSNDQQQQPIDKLFKGLRITDQKFEKLKEGDESKGVESFHSVGTIMNHDHHHDKILNQEEEDETNHSVEDRGQEEDQDREEDEDSNLTSSKTSSKFNNNANTNSLPKLKLIWKAGGILSSII